MTEDRMMAICPVVQRLSASLAHAIGVEMEILQDVLSLGEIRAT